MDKLTRDVQEHGKISEAFAFYEKSLPAFSGGGEGNYLEDFRKFLDEYLVKHFEFEETEIYPVILANGVKEEKALIQQLQEQHSRIMSMIEQFKKLISQYGLNPVGDQVNAFIGLNKEIIATMLEHACKEDKELFPIVKKYEINFK